MIEILLRLSLLLFSVVYISSSGEKAKKHILHGAYNKLHITLCVYRYLCEEFIYVIVRPSTVNGDFSAVDLNFMKRIAIII